MRAELEEEDADIHSEGWNFQSLHRFEERGIKMRVLLFLLPAFPAAAALVPNADGLTVYDPVNNITSLADLSLPASNRFGLPLCNGARPQVCVSVGGAMHYQFADAWVAAMNGSTSTPVVSGSLLQSGSLSPPPIIKIGGIAATVQFAGLVSPGEFQFNVVIPGNTPDGDQSIAATYNGITTQSGTLLAVQH